MSNATVPKSRAQNRLPNGIVDASSKEFFMFMSPTTVLKTFQRLNMARINGPQFREAYLQMHR